MTLHSANRVMSQESAIDKGTYLTGYWKMAGENDTFLLTRPDFEMTSDSAAVMYSLIGSCKT